MRQSIQVLCAATLIFGLFGWRIVIAQEESACSIIVPEVIATLSDLCADTERNQVCYGNLTLVAEPQPDVTDLQFDSPGDIEDVVKIHSLTLSPLDEDVPEWGVALMKLQANLPDVMPGQNVTVLLFGDVELINAVEPENTEQPPMQAFYLRSGIGDSPCDEAPESGVLIQTPRGVGMVVLTVNGVDILFGSTVFLQAQPDDALYIYLLDGWATATAFDEERIVPVNSYVTVPLDENLTPSGPPTTPNAYPSAAMNAVTNIEDDLWPSEASLVFNMAHCGEVDPQVGQSVLFMQGVFCSTDEAEARQALVRNYPISIDGQFLPTRLGMAYEPCHGGMVGYNINAYADWVATAGAHVFSSYNFSDPFSCTFTVVP